MTHRLIYGVCGIASAITAQSTHAALIQFSNSTGYFWRAEQNPIPVTGAHFLPYVDSGSQPHEMEFDDVPALRQHFGLPTSSGGGGGVMSFTGIMDGAMVIGVTDTPSPIPTINIIREFSVGATVSGAVMFDTRAAYGSYTTFQAPRVFYTGLDLVFGVRFTLPDGVHYGWVYAHRPNDANWYQPVVWAYESTPDTPALVTVPGAPTFALAIASGFLFARRRR